MSTAHGNTWTRTDENSARTRLRKAFGVDAEEGAFRYVADLYNASGTLTLAQTADCIIALGDGHQEERA